MVTSRPSVPVSFCVTTTATRGSQGLRRRPFASGAAKGSAPDSTSTFHKVPTTFELPSRACSTTLNGVLESAVAFAGSELDARGVARLVRLFERNRRARFNLLLVENALDRWRVALAHGFEAARAKPELALDQHAIVREVDHIKEPAVGIVVEPLPALQPREAAVLRKADGIEVERSDAVLARDMDDGRRAGGQE